MILPVQQDDDLARDFIQADKVTGAIHVWWLGQSGFLVKWNGQGMVLDPYLSDSISRKAASAGYPMPRISERVIDPLRLRGVDVVVCTSLAPDRFDPETILPLRAANPSLKLVVPAGAEQAAEDLLGAAAPPILPVDAGTYVQNGDFDIHGIHAAVPKIHRNASGHCEALGYVVSFGSFTLFHSGQTVWHQSLVKEVRRWPVNLAFLPIHGGATTRNGKVESLNGFQAATLARAISASMAIPCHYDLFDDGNVSTEEFTSCSERLAQRFRVMELGQRMTMGPLTDPSGGKALPSEPFAKGSGLGY